MYIIPFLSRQVDCCTRNDNAAPKSKRKALHRFEEDIPLLASETRQYRQRTRKNCDFHQLKALFGSKQNAYFRVKKSAFEKETLNVSKSFYINLWPKFSNVPASNASFLSLEQLALHSPPYAHVAQIVIIYMYVFRGAGTGRWGDMFPLKKAHLFPEYVGK